MYVCWVVVVRCKSASALEDRRGLWWKVSDACHQHACHQVETDVRMFEDDVT